MTDRELLKSLLKKCAVNSYLHTSEYFIDNKWAMFNSKSQCTYLNLYNEGLKEIPDELFELKHLKHLELISNNIKTIPKSLYDSIDEVYIDDTVTIVDDTKPKEVKMTDRELVKSILKQCKGEYSYTLDNFSKDKYVKFNKFDQCTHLDLSSEKLTEIPDELFELKHLKYLDLRNNDIKEIPKSLYDSIDKVYIDDTVTIIDDTKPKELKMTDRELVKSILTYCKGEYSYTLDDFSKDKYVKFNKLDQCTHLDLSSEKLKEIPDELFELKHLKHLWLTFNSIKEIPKSLIYRVDEMYIDDTVTIVDDTKPTTKIKSLIDALIAKKSKMDATKGSLDVLNNEFDDIIQKIKNL